MSKGSPSTSRSGTASAPGRVHSHLNATILIASAINGEGNLDLLDPDMGSNGTLRRIEFCLDGEGGFFARRGDEHLPFDHLMLARCITETFGDFTPPLFHLEADADGSPSLWLSDPEHDQRRIQLLYDAFSLYLIAYEERLI